MKNYLYVFSLIVFGSCTQDQILEDTPPIVEDLYLNFDIHDDVYNEEDQDRYAVISEQDLETSIQFLDAKYSFHRYPFYNHIDISDDSIFVIGTLTFNAEQSFGFKDKEILFEITVKEAKAHLDQLSDSTYVYSSNKPLYEQLMTKNFGNKNLFGESDLSTVFITIPSTPKEFDFMAHYNYTSNGFYFSEEDLSFTSIEYDENNDRIIAEGNFEVQLKQLSCGFYSTHALTNASFKLLLQ